jgi:hypothetical protein
MLRQGASWTPRRFSKTSGLVDVESDSQLRRNATSGKKRLGVSLTESTPRFLQRNSVQRLNRSGSGVLLSALSLPSALDRSNSKTVLFCSESGGTGHPLVLPCRYAACSTPTPTQLHSIQRPMLSPER